MDNVILSLITGAAAILVAWITTRNKVSRADFEALRNDLEKCKRQNADERNELALQLKAALDEKNNLLNENWLLMRKLILRDTDPKIRKGKR